MFLNIFYVSGLQNFFGIEHTSRYVIIMQRFSEIDWVAFTLSHATKALRESRGIALFLTSGLEGGEGSATRPGRNLLPGKSR